jgi:hypothetical protein
MSAVPAGSVWMRLGDAATYLHCSERFLRELARTRQIRSAVVAHKLHFDVADLDAYIRSCTREAVES